MTHRGRITNMVIALVRLWGFGNCLQAKGTGNHEGDHAVVPAFRIKVDAVKGMPTYGWFYADNIGEYAIECAAYCGVDHSGMVAKLKIVPEKEFKKKLEQEGD